MKKIVLLLVVFTFFNLSIATAMTANQDDFIKTSSADDDYGIQWQMNFGSNDWYGARYEGPQPIGDCDNDGDNEILIAGRDSSLRVFEWNDDKQTYLEKHTLHPPFYPDVDSDAGGFAIGDLTGDGKNEIAATWSATVYKYISGKYRIIGWNDWIFKNGGGNGDCYIGDCDNDGKNELIMSGGPLDRDSTVPEIVVFEWNGICLVKESEWSNPDENAPYTYVYMAGVGDIDYDGENEIVCGSGFKVWALDWNKNTKSFDATVIKETIPDQSNDYFPYPFACVLKDSDNDGKAEINVGYMTPEVSVFEWNGESYITKFETSWDGENSIIEALDVGDCDNDGLNELCAGTNLVHILQYNEETYIEEKVLPTWGWLAVLNIGDIDNDGENELNAASVDIDHGQDYMSWTYKYGWESNSESPSNKTGRLEVTVKNKIINENLGGGSIGAWDEQTNIWYDIEPVNDEWGKYSRYDLPVGEYLLRVTLDGYKSQELDIIIEPGETTSCVFNLQKKGLSKNLENEYISPIFSILKYILNLFF